MSTKILIVCGSSREDGHLRQLTSLAADTLRTANVDFRELDLKDLQLPVMVWGDREQADLPSVKLVRESARWADAFILATPEYHGNMSGALKNYFDFLYGEFAGKFAGVLASTGGGTGDMSITAVKNCVQWCHGFTLPFHCAASNADFVDGSLKSKKVEERVRRIAYDVLRYGEVIRSAFESAKELGPGIESGTAGLHLKQ